MMRTNSWIPAVFNDLFDTDYMPKCNATAPAINVKESDKAYTVELAAPGMKKQGGGQEYPLSASRVQLLKVRADTYSA